MTASEVVEINSRELMAYCSECLDRSKRDLDTILRGEMSIYDLPFDVRVWVLFGTLRAWNG
jgi:hypothetical protein